VIDLESVDDWRIWGFIDDTGVQTCQSRSGPVGLEEGPGRTWQQHAICIQREYYGYAYHY
jgi:hypothetical protein